MKKASKKVVRVRKPNAKERKILKILFDGKY
jgi:hypothetical protein